MAADGGRRRNLASAVRDRVKSGGAHGREQSRGPRADRTGDGDPHLSPLQLADHLRPDRLDPVDGLLPRALSRSPGLLLLGEGSRGGSPPLRLDPPSRAGARRCRPLLWSAHPLDHAPHLRRRCTAREGSEGRKTGAPDGCRRPSRQSGARGPLLRVRVSADRWARRAPPGSPAGRGPSSPTSSSSAASSACSEGTCSAASGTS
jgi:hypothetical protein